MRYWLGLGANLGDRERSVRRAVTELDALGRVVAKSRIYSSAPVGGPPQPNYLNACVCLETSLSPSELLASALSIERALGRDRSTEVRWGPRTIDVDLLLAGDRGEIVLVLPGLELPHPRLAERAFALAGIVEHEPNLMHPVAQRPLSALLRESVSRGEPIAPIGEPL